MLLFILVVREEPASKKPSNPRRRRRAKEDVGVLIVAPCWLFFVLDWRLDGWIGGSGG